MKTKLLIPAVIVSSFVICHSSFGQGALTPPGAPGPTMLTLSQIEPRTPIATAPFIITNSGAYYLATNLTVSGGDAITISASGVTLDLNGFTISSTAASANGNAVLLTNIISDITILNGHIKSGVTNNGSGVYSGPGFYSGIFVLAQNVRVRGVTVSGVLNDGIFLRNANSTVVEDCEVHTAGGYGIVASMVKSSPALDIGKTAIGGDQVSDCYGQSTAVGEGISATVVQNSYGYASADDGINAAVANNCYGQSGSGAGVSAGVANNCYGYSDSSYGIYVSGAAIGCYGSTFSGIGVGGHIANSCFSSTGDGALTYHYNMP